MKYIWFFLILWAGCVMAKDNPIKLNPLSVAEKRVILEKGTEAPFSGTLNNFYKEGTYVCKQCDLPLYRSSSKFDGHCGWPSFDDEIEGAVTHFPDADGRRTEIVCSRCGAHLGHLFLGEGFTEKNQRHCVNSISLKFIPAPTNQFETAFFSEGCFWGAEYWMEKPKGVIDVTSGYMGGHIKNPTYRQVCSGKTGHAETVKVVFDPQKISYEKLVKLFFETHDSSQLNRQGPDIGTQYRSAIFYTSEKQKKTAEKLKDFLIKKGDSVVTEITPASTFYPAEKYHQDYYSHKKTRPYCHRYKARF